MRPGRRSVFVELTRPQAELVAQLLHNYAESQEANFEIWSPSNAHLARRAETRVGFALRRRP